ncbi:ComEC/Rec2 family competence protein [Aeoliella sp. ICT_H6.2]|uniref:ComEC/Rec2 family competence protein n=1 Tax=Aeoliella straminimaris TaxID=2954799 RepID=A0A9X2FEQ1_9BACT|nr:ComEC/Rec2 family competence protein [Aeoliella straminimaris]MCO6047670.1 ComEC/Rec2 family competence protein [Aeoliella straminimaris]
MPAGNSKPPDRPGRRRRAPLVAVALAVMAGIVLDRGASDRALEWPGCGQWWLLSAVLLAAWLWLRSSGRHLTGSVVVLVAAASLAGGWHHWHWNLFSYDDLGRMATLEPYPCCIQAVANAAPERVAAPPESPYRAIPQGEKSQLLITVTRVRNGEHWQPAAGQCELIVDGHLLGVNAGDRVQVFGQFRAPSPARNPGQFDYALHLRADRQLAYVRSQSPDCVTLLQRGSPWNPARWVDNLRSSWQSRLWSALGPQRAPTAAALLLGARNSMPREAVDAFRVTGALHVLVVSGLHAGILMSLVFGLLGMGLLPRRQALLVAVAIVIFYAILTGAHPPVVRAAVLTVLACIGLWFDEQPFALNSLAIAALVVLGLNPADLFRTGPQLSFLCVTVLLWFVSVRWRRPLTPLEFLLRSCEPWYVRAMRWAVSRAGLAMLATLAVWIVSLPLLLESYHLVTPIAVLACVPVFLTVAASLVTGFALLVVGWIVPPLEGTLAAANGLCLDALDWLVNSTSHWPHAYSWSPAPAMWWIVGWYALAPVLLAAGGTRFGWRRTVQLAAVWIACGAAGGIVARSQPQQLEVTFLDVGHGVCAVVTTPEGATLLYDAGSLGSPHYATSTISEYLWSRGSRQIDAVVLSHADVDHFNAVPGLIDRFSIGRVFVSPHMLPPPNDTTNHSAPAELQRLLVSHSIPIEQVELGDRLTLDSVTVADVLYPDRLGSFGGDNSNSLVLVVESAGQRVMLPGDLESPGIDYVMDEPPADCDVLLAPHHGSRRSDPPGFAAWSTPEVVIVSGGPGTVDRNVQQSYQQLGAEVLFTAERGAISAKIDSAGFTISTYLP